MSQKSIANQGISSGIYKRPFFSRVKDFGYEFDRVCNPEVRRGGHSTFAKEKLVFICLILAVPIIHWLVFWLYINIQSIILAFQDMRTGEFTFYNFEKFWGELTKPLANNIGVAIRNTLLYFANSIIVIMPLSLVISFFIYKKILFYKGFRIIFYLPAIISGIAMVQAYTRFIAPKGPLGAIVKFFGGEMLGEGLLANKSSATWTILVYCIWTGFTSNVLLYSGGMARIPIEVLESAKLEGCGPFREIVSIVLPLIWPTISTMIVFAMTGLFSSSGPILLFTQGQYETTTLSYWIFEQVYGGGKFGGSGSYNLVSCTGLCFTLVGVPVILTVRYLMEKVDSVEY